MTVVISAVLLTGLAVVLLGVRVLFVKGGKFPSTHIHQNEALRRRGIGCASADTDRK